MNLRMFHHKAMPIVIVNLLYSVITIILHYSIMIVIITVWIILITTQQVRSNKVITVNNNGKSSAECCVDGKKCACDSLFTALRGITNSTIVNITSQSVTLENVTEVTTSLSNIMITSENATIRCNNNGSVSLANAMDVIIKGITWDQCGNPYVDGGISFSGVTDLTIDNCTFQNSQICAVNLHKASSNITIKNSYFISNGLRKIPSLSGGNNCGGLKIDIMGDTSMLISDSVFSDNSNRPYDSIYGLVIESTDNEANVNLVIDRTKFLSNSGGMYLTTVTNTFANIT